MIVIDKRFWLQSFVPAFQCYSDEESAETETLIWNDVAEQVFRDFLSYNPKGQNGSYIDGDHIDC